MLGDACNELDLILAESSPDNISSNSTYSQYVSLIRRKSELQSELHDQLTVLNEMVTLSSISLPDAEHNDVFKELRKDVDATTASLNNKVTTYV